jgi:hypothetical protein
MIAPLTMTPEDLSGGNEKSPGQQRESPRPRQRCCGDAARDYSAPINCGMLTFFN